MADLAPLVLELAAWGVSEARGLAWLDPPPEAAFAQAQDLLQRLEAIDAQGRITAMGKAMVKLPLHPRLAHMVVKGGKSARRRTRGLAVRARRLGPRRR